MGEETGVRNGISDSRRGAGPVVTVGLLHPGAMGAAVGRCLRTAGHRVVWASALRGAATAERAAAAGLDDLVTVEALADAADVILSVCPPDRALEVARSVAGYGGIYLDANAVAPATVQRIAATLPDARVVDGAVIGLPPQPGTDPARRSRLYVAGPVAVCAEVVDLFEGTDLEALALDGPVGTASALKMAYAGWTKASDALLLTVGELASRAGVADALRREWDHSQPGLGDRYERARHNAAEKGWRWAGEMEEIAAFLTAQGLPPGALHAAATLYRDHPRPGH